nr:MULTISPECIES: DUF3592 domain-containing protein [unclassified Ruminococcus]
MMFTIGGAAALVLSLWSGLTVAKLNEKCTETAVAEIVEYEKVTAMKYHSSTVRKFRPKTAYTPVYVFEVDGENYVGEDSDIGSNIQQYPIGTLVQIHYDPSDNYFVDMANIKLYAGGAAGLLLTLIGILGLTQKLFRMK